MQILYRQGILIKRENASFLVDVRLLKIPLLKLPISLQHYICFKLNMNKSLNHKSVNRETNHKLNPFIHDDYIFHDKSFLVFITAIKPVLAF